MSLIDASLRFRTYWHQSPAIRRPPFLALILLPQSERLKAIFEMAALKLPELSRLPKLAPKNHSSLWIDPLVS
jgi:hypothetical protein